MWPLVLLIIHSALSCGVNSTFAPALHEIRGPIYVEEMKRCLPDDMYQLLNMTMDLMKDMHPTKPAGTAYPVDKWAWYANVLTHHIKGGKSFCESYALTTQTATGYFSNHVFRGAALESYMNDCSNRLRSASSEYARHAASQRRPGPLTRANDPLVNCLTTAAKVAGQARLMESVHPEK